jgi:hypothetical protein
MEETETETETAAETEFEREGWGADAREGKGGRHRNVFLRILNMRRMALSVELDRLHVE